jgi:multicomponent Na+:H+ antiporter subunit C
METVLAIVVGGLFAAGLYTILRRSVVRLAIGLVMIGHAANLLIFTVAGLRRGEPPILPGYEAPAAAAGSATASLPVADPLPQALVLTAIVIGFAVLAFTLVLVHRVYQLVGTDDVDALTTTDRLTEEEKPD